MDYLATETGNGRKKKKKNKANIDQCADVLTDMLSTIQTY